MDERPIHRAAVRDEWLDYNGHLNEAYYVLIFSHATDALALFMGSRADHEPRRSEA